MIIQPPIYCDYTLRLDRYRQDLGIRVSSRAIRICPELYGYMKKKEFFSLMRFFYYIQMFPSEVAKGLQWKREEVIAAFNQLVAVFPEILPILRAIEAEDD